MTDEFDPKLELERMNNGPWTEDNDVEICQECGESVARGSGKWVNRIHDPRSRDNRIEAYCPFPDGDWLCYECSEEAYNSPSRFADELRRRLMAKGLSPDEPINKITWEDVITVLATVLVEEGKTPEELDDADLEYYFDKGYEGANLVDWYEPIRIKIMDGWNKPQGASSVPIALPE